MLDVNKHYTNNEYVIQNAVVVGVLNQLIDYNLSSLVNQKTTTDIINDYFVGPMSMSLKASQPGSNLLDRSQIYHHSTVMMAQHV